MSRQNKLCIASQRHAKIKSLTKRPGQTCIDVSLANNWLFFPLWIIQIIFFQAIPDILNQSGRARLWHSKRKHHISQWLKTQRCISGSDYIRCSGWQKAPLHITLLWNPDVQSPHYMKCRLLTKKKKKEVMGWFACKFLKLITRSDHTSVIRAKTIPTVKEAEEYSPNYLERAKQ